MILYAYRTKDITGDVRMSITEEHVKENLSKAYVEAVVARAGFGYAESKNDYGIDGTIKEVLYNERRRRYTDSGFNLDFQLKSTVNAEVKDNEIIYDLRAKNYSDLIDEEIGTPRILILYSMPSESDVWLENNQNNLILRNGAWWVSLRGYPDVDNRESVRIKIPVENLLSVTELKRMMQYVKEGRVL